MSLIAASSPDFEAWFANLLASKREASAAVNQVVGEILDAVRLQGDAAVIELTSRFDAIDLTVEKLAIGRDEVDAALGEVDGPVIAALECAHARLVDHHTRQRPADLDYRDDTGVRLGQRWTPVDAVGLYVPGGTASYPSSVLMNAVPARVAGVGRIVMVVPTPRGEVNPAVLAAARIAGVDEIYRIGGAQAVAALAFGTQTIRAVDTIVGPGNAYVAAAKRQVFGTVGIDMVAGPSEVLVIADDTADARVVAADLLAQAEHDAAAQSILVTPSAALAEGVAGEVERQLQRLPRAETAGASWRDNGAIIVVEDLEQAARLANRIAAEHLELSVEDPGALAAQIRHAGAIFLGHNTPEVIGDYVGGTNHVLPTARSARFSSGLGVYDFMKRSALLQLERHHLEALGPHAVALARCEGLEAHARSILARLDPGSLS